MTACAEREFSALEASLPGLAGGRGSGGDWRRGSRDQVADPRRHKTHSRLPLPTLALLPAWQPPPPLCRRWTRTGNDLVEWGELGRHRIVPRPSWHGGRQVSARRERGPPSPSLPLPTCESHCSAEGAPRLASQAACTSSRRIRLRSTPIRCSVAPWSPSSPARKATRLPLPRPLPRPPPR